MILGVAGGLVGLLISGVLTWGISKEKRLLKGGVNILAIYIGGQWALSNWDKILLYINRAETDIRDPILGMPTSFYLFELPIYNSIYALIVVLVFLSLLGTLAAAFLRIDRDRGVSLEMPQSQHGGGLGAVYFSAGVLAIVLALGKYLDRFGLMYSPLGVVTGPGWTDVHVRLPMYSIVIAVTLIAGLVLIVPFFRNRVPVIGESIYGAAVPLVEVAAVTAVVWFLLLGVVPGFFQWLKVQPNEITLERPYIKNNIEFTRRGFGLDKIEEKRFEVSDQFTEQTIAQNETLLENIRLWDWRALDSVYKQFQEIRLYYEFADVDVDRYTFNDEYRQVMVSAREMQVGNLPVGSQTFVNKRFKYTHGNGIALNTVSEFTPEGLPNLLVKDIPPVSVYPELEVDQPRIYYGELTESHVIANSKEKEFDYPQGEENVYVHYDGAGGVELSNLWRKFLFGWKFDGTRFFVSDYPRPESRVMFHRRIQERVRLLAPFLRFDNDPYIVLAGGRLYWMIDAYAVSADYPYSEPLASQRMVRTLRRRSLFNGGENLAGVNYIRNSVKTVVDAYNGDVSFYIFDEEDPLIQTWSRVFEGMFKGQDEMPEDLLKHIRYPSDFLEVQGMVYMKYHMTDPVVFYNQEDLWVRATEKYYGQTVPVEPYYIMWEMPGADDAEFVLMMPFTPKNKQVLIGWIAGMCDPGNYGKLLSYKFPKEKRVLGTQQVETKIDQDRFLSGQLSLWDQRGSRVIRGNVLVIPIEDTIIYVEPIYLQAETAAYPELRLVAVMHDDRLSYAESFGEALYGLVREQEPELKKGTVQDRTVKQLIDQANEAFDNYLNALGQKQFDQASQNLEKLSKSLKGLMETGQVSEPNGTAR